MSAAKWLRAASMAGPAAGCQMEPSPRSSFLTKEVCVAFYGVPSPWLQEVLERLQRVF